MLLMKNATRREGTELVEDEDETEVACTSWAR
jgi:hypothetical protein